jgi:hypothetical protein
MYFYCRDVPEDMTVMQYIKSKSNWRDQVLHVKRSFAGDHPQILKAKIDEKVYLRLKEAVNDAISVHGSKGWRSSEGESQYYGGLSIVRNPSCREGGDESLSATLGTDRNSRSEFFYGSKENHKRLKNSYFDTYSFRELNHLTDQSGLTDFIRSCHFPVIRSRIAVLEGAQLPKENYLLHKDEPVFENFRLNIPILSNENFGMEIDGQVYSNFRGGYAYTWNTHVPHRPVMLKENNISRVHLVLGLSPWLSYDPEKEAWFPNEYMGRVHPLELFMENKVSSSLEWVPHE